MSDEYKAQRRAAERKNKEFVLARRAVEEHMEDVDIVLNNAGKSGLSFGNLRALIERHNTARELAKKAVRAIEAATETERIGQWTRSRPSTRLSYDPAMLPDHVLRMPGVVKVSSAKISELLKSGEIEFNEISDARQEGKPVVKIDGPGEFNLTA